MPLHDSHAFMLRTFTLKEADKICVFLTKDAGKLRGVAKGARRLRSRFGASLEPFTEVQLTYFQAENRELVALSQCEILHSPFVSGLSSERLGTLHYLAELIIEFLPDHEPNAVVYRLVSATLAALKTADDEQLTALTRYFELWLLKLGGFLAAPQQCAGCAEVFAPTETIWLNNEGAAYCHRCSQGRGDALAPTARTLWGEILKQAPQAFLTKAQRVTTLSTDLASLGELTARLIRRTLERELKSYELLDRLRPVVSCPSSVVSGSLTTDH